MNTVRSPETDDFHWPLVQTSSTLHTEMRKKRCNLRQLHKSTLGISSDASHPSLLEGTNHPAELTWWLLPQTHRLHPWPSADQMVSTVGKIFVTTWLWASTWEQWRHVFTQCKNSITYATFLTSLLMQILLAHPTSTSLPAHDPGIVGGYGCQSSIPSRNTHRSSTLLIKLGCRKAGAGRPFDWPT